MIDVVPEFPKQDEWPDRRTPHPWPVVSPSIFVLLLRLGDPVYMHVCEDFFLLQYV